MVPSGPAISRGLPFPEHPFWGDLPSIVPDLDRVRATVVREAASADGAVGHALENYVSRPGKMLRPGLVLVGSWAGKTGPDEAASERLIQIAAAVETLHLATLIHDDVIDEADTRRGRPALHTLYGRRQAVLMGDYLLSRCFSMIAAGTERENALRLAAATGHLVRGEINQMFDAAEGRFSRRSYLRRIAGKTAMLFGLSLVTGAAETKAKRREIALLARAGYNLGIAFQIIDDILDFTSQTETLGKPVAADLRAGIYNLPVIEAVRRDDRIRAAVVPPPASESEARAAVELIRAAGGVDRARESAARYTERAHEAISRLSSRPQRVALEHVAGRLLERDY
ncbi:MAG: polyprenyl synthetase family protein [Spirochaetota bacterium]